MDATTEGQDLQTAYRMKPPSYRSRIYGGRPRQANGRVAAQVLAPRRPCSRCKRHAAKGARARRGPGPVPRPAGAGRVCCTPAAAIAARHFTTARSRTTASAAAITAGSSTRQGHCLEQPCEPDGGKFKDKVRQPWYPLEERYGLIFAYMGPPEKQAGAAALRLSRDDGRGRVRRSRRFIDRRRRAGDHSVQLAAALRERGRSVPCAGAARLVLGRAVHQHDGVDAGGDVRDQRPRRDRAVGAQAGRRQGVLSRHRGGVPDAARRAESARRAVRAGGIDRLGAADRRHVVPHLRGRPRASSPATSAACARNSTASSGGT